MKNLAVSEARSKFSRLIEEVEIKDAPVRIVGRRNSAILVGEQYWRDIHETLHLLSIPSMRNSIRQGLRTRVEGLSGKLFW